MKERLTLTGVKLDYSNREINGEIYGIEHPYGKHINFAQIYNRLAEYEDLEEQGLIVRLPCKVGDKVYIAGQYGMRVSEYVLSKIKLFIERDSVLISYFAESTTDKFIETSFWFTHNFIGEFVFLTREEAEKRLKELKGE